jgi:DNA-binding MarR family transcriptional regulator
MSDEPEPLHLQDEIRQRQPFRSASREAVLGLFRTADLLRHELARIIEPHGVTMQQYNVLRILRGAGETGLPTLAIAERMIERAPGITRIADRLEQVGLVTRIRSREDRRQVVCRITPAGLDLLARIDPAVDENDDRILAMLAVDEQHELIRLLERIRAGYR